MHWEPPGVSEIAKEKLKKKKNDNAIRVTKKNKEACKSSTRHIYFV